MPELIVTAGDASPRQDNTEVQDHPYQPFVPPGSQVLILGSAPPYRFCVRQPKPLHAKDMDWYYGSYCRSYNMLWELLFLALDPEGLTDLLRIRALEGDREHRTQSQRDFLQDWLARRKLGIMDILLRFERRSGSASDAKLKPQRFTNLLDIIAATPSVSSICCTSRHRVLEWLAKYLRSQGIALNPEKTGYSFPLPHSYRQAQNPCRIRVLVLPAPSPIGRIRFPSHQDWLEYLTTTYSHLFRLAFSFAGEN